jgi:hypothetical protein
MRAAYLQAAGSAAALLRSPAVAERWSAPSALSGFTVGGLAEHLGLQVLNAVTVLSNPAPAGTAPVRLSEHYGRVPWVGAGLDDESNVAIRSGGEQAAAEGVAGLLARIDGAIEALRSLLPAARGDQPVVLPWTGWALTVDDFLLTRMMEIAVHSDDLAVSVEMPTPPLPARVFAPVVRLLTDLAAERHGQPALLRALTRRERAGSIAVF